MVSVEIVPATLAHVQIIGETMNDEDRDEIEAAGLVPRRALWRGWKNSIMRYTALVDNVPAAIWGVEGSVMGGVGVVWFITAKKAREVSPHRFRSIYVGEVRKMLEIYDTLVNCVAVEYDGAVRMLKIAGFNLDEPQPLGRLRRMYSKFSKEA